MKQTDVIPFLGEIAQMRLNYIREYKPQMIEDMTIDEMKAYLNRYQDEYLDKYEKLFQELMEKNGVNQELRAQSWITYIQKQQMCSHQAMEFIREEIES